MNNVDYRNHEEIKMPTNQGFFLTRTTYEPDIIDLRNYEADLLYQREHDISLRPPPPVPSILMCDWTKAEMDAMERNRKDALAIYDRIRHSCGKSS